MHLTFGNIFFCHFGSYDVQFQVVDVLVFAKSYEGCSDSAVNVKELWNKYYITRGLAVSPQATLPWFSRRCSAFQNTQLRFFLVVQVSRSDQTRRNCSKLNLKLDIFYYNSWLMISTVAQYSKILQRLIRFLHRKLAKKASL